MAKTGLISRRALCVGLASIASPAFAFAPLARPLPGNALAGLRFRSLVVDNGPMAAKGGRAFVSLMTRATSQALAKAFADKLAPGDRNAPVLRVVLDSASFASDGETNDEFTSPTDNFEGWAEIVGARGAVEAVYPVLSALGVTSRHRNIDDGYELRAQLLAEHFAYWMRRAIGV